MARKLWPTRKDRLRLIDELRREVLRLQVQNRRLQDHIEIALERRCEKCKDLLVSKLMLGESWNND
ncbi:MAG TPA: hypothetical protein DIT46_02805 [Gemmatimonadetes bacterium]|nr:hypothetical protein [Gemmatimonadota bacterium]